MRLKKAVKSCLLLIIKERRNETWWQNILNEKCRQNFRLRRWKTASLLATHFSVPSIFGKTKKLQLSDSANYLDVVLDDKLTWNTHYRAPQKSIGNVVVHLEKNGSKTKCNILAVHSYRKNYALLWLPNTLEINYNRKSESNSPTLRKNRNPESASSPPPPYIWFRTIRLPYNSLFWIVDRWPIEFCSVKI